MIPMYGSLNPIAVRMVRKAKRRESMEIDRQWFAEQRKKAIAYRRGQGQRERRQKREDYEAFAARLT